LSESTPVISGNPATGDFQFSYDTAGRLQQETTPDSKNARYQLDANGNLTQLTYPDGYFVSRVYDQLNRLTDIKLNGATTSAVHIDYDQLSRRSVLTYGNGASTTYTFQLNDDMTDLAEAFTGSSVTFSYGFNNVHQETSRSVSDTNYLWHPSAGDTTAYAATNSVNEYTTVGGASYDYDGNANLTSDGTWSYTFDTENHLLTANMSGTSASYVYDPSHRQVQKTVGSTETRYVYAGWQRIADYDGITGMLENRYVYGGGLDEPLIVVSSAGVLTYLHADRLGSIIATTDSTGTVTNQSKYSPFGENAPLGTTFGFTSQRYDAETGLYYCKRRHYSPPIGRFLQPDPIGYIGGDLNIFSYVRNDPCNNVDPFGLQTAGQQPGSGDPGTGGTGTAPGTGSGGTGTAPGTGSGGTGTAPGTGSGGTGTTPGAGAGGTGTTTTTTTLQGTIDGPGSQSQYQGNNPDLDDIFSKIPPAIAPDQVGGSDPGSCQQYGQPPLPKSLKAPPGMLMPGLPPIPGVKYTTMPGPSVPR
jgi:RHS repeat-associated protein